MHPPPLQQASQARQGARGSSSEAGGLLGLGGSLIDNPYFLSQPSPLASDGAEPADTPLHQHGSLFNNPSLLSSPSTLASTATEAADAPLHARSSPREAARLQASSSFVPDLQAEASAGNGAAWAGEPLAQQPSLFTNPSFVSQVCAHRRREGALAGMPQLLLCSTLRLLPCLALSWPRCSWPRLAGAEPCASRAAPCPHPSAMLPLRGRVRRRATASTWRGSGTAHGEGQGQRRQQACLHCRHGGSGQATAHRPASLRPQMWRWRCQAALRSWQTAAWMAQHLGGQRSRHTTHRRHLPACHSSTPSRQGSRRRARGGWPRRGPSRMLRQQSSGPRRGGRGMSPSLRASSCCTQVGGPHLQLSSSGVLQTAPAGLPLAGLGA